MNCRIEIRINGNLYRAAGAMDENGKEVPFDSPETIIEMLKCLIDDVRSDMVRHPELFKKEAK